MEYWSEYRHVHDMIVEHEYYLASTRACACCLTNIPAAISGAYCRSVNSYPMMVAPHALALSCRRLTMVLHTSPVSDWRDLPVLHSYGYIELLVFKVQ